MVTPARLCGCVLELGPEAVGDQGLVSDEADAGECLARRAITLSVDGELTLLHMHRAWRRCENILPAVGEQEVWADPGEATSRAIKAGLRVPSGTSGSAYTR